MCDQCCIAPVCNALAEGKAATGTGATRLATDTERKPTKTDWQATAAAKGRAIATETNCLRAGQDKA